MKTHVPAQTRTQFAAHAAVLAMAAWVLLAPDSTAAEPGWESRPGHRVLRTVPVGAGKTGFTRLEAVSVGIGFTNALSDARSVQNRNLLSGSGVAAGDVDGDGRCDVYLCGLDSKNRLYRNLGGWKFEDITAAAGLDFPAQDSTAAAFADVDGDGHLDLLVNSLGHGTRLFINDGRGRFKETTIEAGLASTHGSMSMALADIDGDGDLDLYVANFRPNTIKDEQTTRYTVQTLNGRPVIASVNGKPATLPEYTNRFEYTASGNVLEFGEPDVLYRNDGKGHFSAVSWTDGSFLDEEGKPLTAAPRDWGLAAQFHDFNGDGAPDLYVCNDLFTPDRIWMNDGKGRFRAINRLAVRNTSTFSMGVDFGDLNRDGVVDFFVVDMLSRSLSRRQTQMADSSVVFWPPGVFDNRPQILRNTLHIGRGDGTFAETAYHSGVEASEWSWGPVFLDVDLDGYEDILVTNGQLRDFQNGDIAMEIEQAKASRKLSPADLLELLKRFPGLHTPNLLFRNRGDLTFEEVGAAWGFATPGIAQGMALADLDNDGDLDVIVNQLQDAPGFYQNDGTQPRVAVRLKGRAPNTRGIGAQIRVRGGPVAQSQEMIAAGRYLSGDDALRTFAAGTPDARLEIEVQWRDGSKTIARDVPANSVCLMEEPSTPAPAPRPPLDPFAAADGKPSWFEDVSQRLQHTHHEEPFDDFARQPLLPNRLSQLGPGVSWQDIDGDGWEDLVIPSGRGGVMGVFKNDGKGGFIRWEGTPLTKPSGRDQTTVLGLGGVLFAGLSNYEDGLTNGGYVGVFDFNRRVSGESILGPTFSTGPLALCDVDGDGDLDLFIGGRCLPGRYPESAPSLLMRNDGGRFSVFQRFENLGLVSGAVFTDLDGDGLPELVLACEWGPVRIFKRGTNPTQFTEVTTQFGLGDLRGWWNGVAACDVDGDGRMDLVVSNWGTNTRYQASTAHPRRLYFGDVSGTGQVDMVEALDSTELGKTVPERELRALAMAMPALRERFPSLAAFGKAGVADVLGDAAPRVRMLAVNTLQSTVFLNRGNRFEPRPLPLEAQLAPAFGVVVGDFDGDGNVDVFLAQNHFATQPLTSRADAGRGLLLRGDGKGNFIAVPGQQSGIQVYGEQRGAAAADYDGDGRLDLVVTQNGAATRLFHNRTATPGVRVHLQGNAGNPAGVGARAWIEKGGRPGATQEIHAGSGYWSQDATMMIFSRSTDVQKLVVAWPGGGVVRYDLPPEALDVVARPDGSLERRR